MSHLHTVKELLGIEEDKPRYECDCMDCEFLGCYEKYDLYFCTADGPELVFRVPEGKVTWISMDGAPHSKQPYIREAYRLAVQQGFLS